MTHSCDEADKPALTMIASALLAESERATGEGREGRLRLAQNINTKLVRLGAPPVMKANDVPHERSLDLIERGIENEDLCAHTRNFLQMAATRLSRFDGAWATSLAPAAAAQVAAGLTQPQESR